MSITEANKYFSSDSERQCQGTVYCYAQGALKFSDDNCWWWLRSPGYGSDDAASVDDDGSVFDLGNYVYYDSSAVRPALWINLGSSEMAELGGSEAQSETDVSPNSSEIAEPSESETQTETDVSPNSSEIAEPSESETDGSSDSVPEAGSLDINNIIDEFLHNIVSAK